MQILTGDIGGTNTRLAMCTLHCGEIEVLQHQNFTSTDFTSLEDIINDYAPAAKADAAAFGVAGPVRQGVSRTTNLPWKISSQQLTKQLGIPRVFLLNDLEAMAWGVSTLEDADRICLQAGSGERTGNQAIIAAGTGLGQAGLYYDGKHHLAFATEGGHTDFCPATRLEHELFEFLRDQYDHVSWERLVSGQGLLNIFSFLLRQNKHPAPDWLTDTNPAATATITQKALDGSDPVCVDTLSWFVELYGREAGNLALKMNATGGLFLGGGIAPKILPALQDGTFLRAFLDKGRMRSLMTAMRIEVICSEQVSLKGLACYAANNKGDLLT